MCSWFSLTGNSSLFKNFHFFQSDHKWDLVAVQIINPIEVHVVFCPDKDLRIIQGYFELGPGASNEPACSPAKEDRYSRGFMIDKQRWAGSKDPEGN